MRKPVMVLCVLLMTVAGLFAQQTPAPKAPAAPATDEKLDGYLASWEKKMREVKVLSAELGRTDKDKVINRTTKFTGWAAYMKSGDREPLNLAAMQLSPEGSKDFSEKLICTGTYLYVFAPAQKEIRAVEIPKPKSGEISEDGFLGLLFGMKSEDAKKRYKMTLPKLKHSPTPGEDQYYVYVDIEPRDDKDKADFARARLVLHKETFLPRQVWFEHANGNEVTWDIPRVNINVKDLDRRLFEKPQTPTGWKLVPVAREQPAPKPSVIRTKER